ncbi:uncharacterized protein BXZ73DRAFT_95832 [Epithele typhae]|uniref:uncharacterized protein n=1 Tax=Epithele typhae TaxID=378194 RepID=UPI0020081CDA|nr:uncharacterized protein BXZ73DRAFT_95832 [Epithele typhae]KAH9946332.1 hypothetical protein BXZ73DRAFT_95832 [Epithele typhae]
MHKCLSIHDILLLVFEQVDGYVFDDAGLNVVPLCREVASLHALAALARTCKGFQEPALDVLWRDIPDLFVLVKYALPSDALDYQEANRTLYIHNPDDASLWRTLDPFVRRIRAVGIPLPYEDSIGRVLDEGSVVEPLAKYLTDKGSGYAFPQLQEVTLHVSWLSQAYCTLLLNPQVRRLQLPSDWYGPCLSPLLRPSLSRLRVVKLDMGSVFKLGNDFIYNLAKALPSLKRFSALPESPGSFPSIHPSSPVEEMQTLDCLLAFVEHCPRLRELKIATLPRFSTGFVFRQGGDVPKAKKLRSLRLWTAPLETSGEHARDVGDFLAQTFPRVKRVDLGLFSVRLPDRAALYAGMLWREEALRRWEEIVDSLGSVDFYAVTFVDMKLYPSPRTFTW